MSCYVMSCYLWLCMLLCIFYLNANACVMTSRVITGAWYGTNTNISTTTTITATADVFMKRLHSPYTIFTHGQRQRLTA